MNRQRQIKTRPCTGRCLTHHEHLRLRRRHSASQPLPGANGARARGLFRGAQRRHPQGVPPRGRAAGARQRHARLVRKDERGHLRPAPQRHGPPRPRDRRRRAARQGHRAVRGLAGDDRPRRQRPDAALRVGQARLRSGRSPPLCRLRRRAADPGGDDGLGVADLRPHAASGRWARLLGRRTGRHLRVVHAAGKSLPRLPADAATRCSRSSPTSGSTRTIGGSSRKPTNCRGPAGPRLQPRQLLQQRRHGLRRQRRSALSADLRQRLRLPAADAVLRHRRLRPGRAAHGAGRAPRPVARALRLSRRDPLRLLGGVQAVALPDGVHRRGPLRRLDRDPPLQRHRRRACRPSRTARPTTTATTASPAASSSTTGTSGPAAPAPTSRPSPTTTTSSTSTTPPGSTSTSSSPRR